MATEKNLYGRITQKIDTAANWEKATNFIPKKGEIIIYSKDENCSYDRIKIGDGTSNVNALPFAESVSSVNGETGEVSITTESLGAVPTSRTINGKALSTNITLTAANLGAVPTSRTINGKALSQNISLSASDVGAIALPTTASIGQIIKVKTINGNGQPTEWETVDPWIITSPNGTQFKLTIDNEGVMTATEVV